MENDFAVTTINLTEKVEGYFKGLNTREKCEFLAYFPESGITQKELASAGVFSTNRSVVHYNLKPYRRKFLWVAEKADAEKYKPIFLTSDGKDLRYVSRFMILVNEDLNTDLNPKTDFLGLFLEKGSPKRLLEIFNRIYSNGLSRVCDLYRFLRDRDTKKLVKRLESFGLVETIAEKTDRLRQYVDKTELGEYFGQFFILPIIDHINNGNKSSGLVAFLENGNRWEIHTQENGQGWLDKVKTF